MAPTAVNKNNPQGGGNKTSPPKKQAQLGFSQGKARATSKTGKKKQHPNMPGQGETGAGKGNNGGGGDIGMGVMEVDSVFTTHTREMLNVT